MNQTLQTQNQLDSRLRTVWRRGQTLHVTAGMLAFYRWGILLFLIGMAIDWMTHMPAPGRIGILVTLLAVSVYKAWNCGWRYARTFNAANTALQIEEHHGGLESLLAAAVQFREARQPSGTSDSLRDETCRRAEEAAAPRGLEVAEEGHRQLRVHAEEGQPPAHELKKSRSTAKRQK